MKLRDRVYTDVKERLSKEPSTGSIIIGMSRIFSARVLFHIYLLVVS